MRYAFIKTLIKEARKNKKIILLTGDLGFTVFEEFKKEFPKRFINMGVAEQNMTGVATGLALSGKIVFAYSIATFATMRPFEQIRNDIASHNLPITVVGTGAGLSYADASITHHAIEDINLMRGIPNMTVLCPGDPVETAWATTTCVKLKKPVYLRLGKKGEPKLYSKFPELKLGKGSLLRKGENIALLATGNIVANALEAAEILAKMNIQSTVISMHTIKPIDEELIKGLSQKYPFLITIEEHSVIGGLGSAVSEVLAQEKASAKLVCLGIPDCFIREIGSQNFLREKLGLTPKKIAQKISQLLRK